MTINIQENIKISTREFTFLEFTILFITKQLIFYSMKLYVINKQGKRVFPSIKTTDIITRASLAVNLSKNITDPLVGYLTIDSSKYTLNEIYAALPLKKYFFRLIIILTISGLFQNWLLSPVIAIVSILVSLPEFFDDQKKVKQFNDSSFDYSRYE